MNKNIIKLQPPVTASVLTRKSRALADVWRTLATRNKELDIMVQTFLDNKILMAMMDNELKLSGGFDPLQNKVNYIVQCVVLLCETMGEDNAMHVFKMHPLAIMLGLKDAVNYCIKPDKDSPYHLKFQQKLITDIVHHLSVELYPSKYYHGVITILSSFEMCEELLDIVLGECYNLGKYQVILQ